MEPTEPGSSINRVMMTEMALELTKIRVQFFSELYSFGSFHYFFFFIVPMFSWHRRLSALIKTCKMCDTNAGPTLQSMVKSRWSSFRQILVCKWSFRRPSGIPFTHAAAWEGAFVFLCHRLHLYCHLTSNCSFPSTPSSACLLCEPRVLELAVDPSPLQEPTTFIIYYQTTHTHRRAHVAYTFIIYGGNVLNAWLNTATQIRPQKAQAWAGKVG